LPGSQPDKQQQKKERNAMETKKLEVMVGQKPTKEIPKDKIGKSHSDAQPKEGEVGGRAIVTRWVECPNGHVTWIYYDTVAYHAYTCAVCGALMVF
jgi:hypothetical protein